MKCPDEFEKITNLCESIVFDGGADTQVEDTSDHSSESGINFYETAFKQ
jgi:hypothetical protein